MKPQNKLGGKLDKIKNKVAYESSKKVSDINRVKKENDGGLSEERLEHIGKLEDEIVTLLTKIQVIEQALDNERKHFRESITKQSGTIAELSTMIKRLKEGLTYYKEGKHYETGTFGDKVLDKGEKASEVLS